MDSSDVFFSCNLEQAGTEKQMKVTVSGKPSIPNFGSFCYMHKPEAKLDSGDDRRDEGVGWVGTTVVGI